MKMEPRVVMMLLVMIMCVVGVLCSPSPSPNQASPQPHLILIVADDLGWNDVSWHNPAVHTPHLNLLAKGKGGVLLEQSYVQPICTPTRSALLTGRYPYTIGRQHGVLWPPEPVGLTLKATLLPQVLKEVGYSTHAVGKWHLGFCNWAYTPTHRGFDSFFGYYTGAEDYYGHFRPPARHHEYRYNPCPNNHTNMDTNETIDDAIKLGFDFRNNTEPDLEVAGTYSTYLFSSYVENLLSSRSPQDPLFLYLPFQSVHSPLQVPEKYIRPYQYIDDKLRRIKLGMVTAMDEAVGRVVAALKDSGHYNNSIIVFTTDNGGPTVSAGNNWPLRGNKTTLWEGGTRGVAFIHSPLLQNTPRESNQLIHVTDWLPTLAGLGGGDVPPETDGMDQWGAIAGDTPSPRTHIYYNIDNTTELFKAGVRMGDFKLLIGDPGPGEWTPPPENVTSSELSTSNAQNSSQVTNNSNSFQVAQDNASSREKIPGNQIQQILQALNKIEEGVTELGEMPNISRHPRPPFRSAESESEEIISQLLSQVGDSSSSSESDSSSSSSESEESSWDTNTFQNPTFPSFGGRAANSESRSESQARSFHHRYLMSNDAHFESPSQSNKGKIKNAAGGGSQTSTEFNRKNIIDDTNLLSPDVTNSRLSPNSIYTGYRSENAISHKNSKTTHDREVSTAFAPSLLAMAFASEIIRIENTNNRAIGEIQTNNHNINDQIDGKRQTNTQNINDHPGEEINAKAHTEAGNSNAQNDISSEDFDHGEQISQNWREVHEKGVKYDYFRWQYYNTLNQQSFACGCNETMATYWEFLIAENEQCRNILEDISVMEKEFIRRLNTKELENESNTKEIKTNDEIQPSTVNIEDNEIQQDTITGYGDANLMKDEEEVSEMLRILGVNKIDIRLYNLADDPEERNNVADSHPEQVKVLLRLILAQLPRYVPADIRPNDPASNPRNFGNVWSPGWCNPQPNELQ